MAKKDINEDTFFGGFEAVVGSLSKDGRTPASREHEEEDMRDPEDITELEEADDYPIVEPEEIIEPTPRNKKPAPKSVETVVEEEEEEEEETEPVSTLGEYEEDVTTYLTEQLASELGWEFGDEDKPKTVKEIIDFMSSIVEENSKPNFANEDIEKLNQYVADGGDIRKYIDEVYKNQDVFDLDISEERNQKKIIAANLARLGYKEERIQKTLSRYEDAGVLEEEAQEAVEELQEFKEKRDQQLLEEQQNFKREARERQQNFFQEVQTSVEQASSIRGIPISSKEKKDLMDYIFKPESDGRTRYQKDYAKDYKNLIESAYFTMKGDTLIKNVTKKATSQAARSLQEKLANKGKRIKGSGGHGNNTTHSWDAVVSQLRRPNF